MQTEVYYACAVEFEDKVKYEFKKDSVCECLTRVNELSVNHGSFNYLLITKFEI